MSDSIIFEDDLVVAELKAEAALGHVIVYPKSDKQRINELTDEEVEHVFVVANVIAASLFEVFRSQGTNMICTDNGQRFTVHVISRTENDGLGFLWEPKQLSPEEMNASEKGIKAALIFGEDVEGKGPEPTQVNVSPIEFDSDPYNNMLIRHLDRPV